MAYGMSGMPGNQRQIGLPRGMSSFPVVGGGMGGLPVRVTGLVIPAGHYIQTPIATPSFFGDPFDGGFYAGMIWNELIQSSTPATIATGRLTLEVSDMGVTPFVYIGQQLEIRSRSNPANNMAGVVVSAKNTTLTVDVATISGSGLLSDWSVMSRYRVIVAPKSSGENVSIALGDGTVGWPAGCATLSEGWRSTLALIAAGNSTVFPAPWWARGLSIAGKTDWYIPARDELEVMQRNLNPSTTLNLSTTRQDSLINYAVLGAYDDISTNNGTNRNSNPAGAFYTGSEPQVAAGKNFRTGESESLEGGRYGTSSGSAEFTSTWAAQNLSLTDYAKQNTFSLSQAHNFRAIRRSII